MSKGIKNNLVALGSAAVFTVYAAGYERTASAAARFANEGDDRLPPPPGAHPGAARAMPPSAAPAPVKAPIVEQPAAKVATSSVKPEKHQMAAHVDTVAPAPSTTQAPAVVAQPTQPPTTTPTAATPAPAPTPASPPPVADSTPKTAPDTAPALKDGTYTGWGTSRHGDIQATVIIKSGRILFAGISECLTQYSCSWIAALPPQVVQRQSAEVDYVSGATQSTRAFYYAVLEALAKAK